MKTNERVKMALKQAAEQDVLHLLEQVQEVADGDLKELEMHILQAAFATTNQAREKRGILLRDVTTSSSSMAQRLQIGSGTISSTRTLYSIRECGRK